MEEMLFAAPVWALKKFVVVKKVWFQKWRRMFGGPSFLVKRWLVLCE